MELFEEIRREHAHGAGTIRAVAKKLGVHRRMVRQPQAVTFPSWLALRVIVDHDKTAHPVLWPDAAVRAPCLHVPGIGG